LELAVTSAAPPLRQHDAGDDEPGRRSWDGGRVLVDPIWAGWWSCGRTPSAGSELVVYFQPPLTQPIPITGVAYVRQQLQDGAGLGDEVDLIDVRKVEVSAPTPVLVADAVTRDETTCVKRQDQDWRGSTYAVIMIVLHESLGRG
jgi:hypothetical protein